MKLTTIATCYSKAVGKLVYYIIFFTFFTGSTYSQNSPEPINGTGPGGTAPFTNMLNCNGTPTFTVNLTGNPSGTWISNPEQRAGDCCNPGGDNNCVQFTLTLDPTAEGIIFNVPDGCGAAPSGSLFYQVDCGPLTSVGTPLCLNGTGPFTVTFCKPGNNENCYSITSIPGAASGGDVITADGCKDTLTVTGLVQSTISWTSISPGSLGQYNNYLNNLVNTQPGISGTAYTGQSTVVVTPQPGYPQVIYYKVCGNVSSICNSNTYCDTVSVTIYPNLFANAGPDVAICNGSIVGTIVTGTAIGGTAPFNYQWTGPGGFSQLNVSSSSSDNITVMVPGLYTLSITDATGCPAATDQVSVTSYNVDITASAGPDITICRTPIPTVNINSSVSQTGTGVWSGGTGSYNAGNTDLTLSYTPSASELAAGSVILTLTPTNTLGCPFTADQVIITLPQFTSSLSAIPTNISCFGQTNGSIDLTVSGGAATTGYLWSNGSSLQDLSGLSIGNYAVTVTDANGCKGTANTSITQPSQLSASITSISHVTCFGGSNGSFTVAGAYATAPYSYSLNGGTPQSGGTFSGLIAGTYTITVIDQNGCTVNVTANVSQPSSSISLNYTQTNVLCYGGSTGAINLTPSGGTAPYSYTWSNGTTTEDINGLQAGIYTVSVNDVNGSFGGCSSSTTVTIFQPPSPLTLTSTQTNVFCFGGSNGSIDLTPAGGTPIYYYTWNNGVTTQDLSGLAIGTYTVTVHDANGIVGGCAATTTITITQPTTPLTLTNAPVNVSCNGGSNGAINLTPSGGTPNYTYWWSNGSTSEDITDLTAGTYTVTVNDANGSTGGCSASSTVTITQPATAVVLSSTQTNVLCYGGSTGAVNLSVIGGTAPYSYNWSNGATTQDVSGLSAGTYAVVVNDVAGNSGGCFASMSITIGQPLIPVSASVTTVDAACFGGSSGSINLTPSGGTTPYFYTWSNGGATQDISGLAAGTYSVIVSDGAGNTGGCSTTINVTIGQPLTPVTLSSTPTNVLCFGGSNGAINIVASGGTPTYNYLWSNGATTANISALTAGTYTVTVTDNNGTSGGCAASATISITQPTMITSSITPSIYTGGYNLSGCLPDGAADLTVSGGNPGYSYSWSNGDVSQDVNDLMAGTYTVTITDANGCQSSNAVTLTAPTTMTQTISAFSYPSGSNISCFGLSDGNVNLTVTGGAPGYSYSWSNGATSQDLANVPAGFYTVTITDANGCQITSSITLTEPTVLTQSLTAYSYPSGANISCVGLSDGSIDLTIGGGSPGYSYSWSNGSTVQDPTGLAVGNYTVVVTDVNGCSIPATITLVQPTILTASVLPSVYAGGYNLTGCNSNGTIDLSVVGGNSGYSYLWSNGSTAQDLSGLSAGTYSVTITDMNGCQTNSSITLAAPNPIVQSLSAFTYPSGSNISCYGLSDGSIDLVVTGGAAPYSYVWSNGANSQDINNVPAGTYSVTITDGNGCQVTSLIVLTQPTALTQTVTAFTFPSGTNISCFGANDGSIDLTIGGGSPGYLYSWTNGSNVQDPSGFAAGTYSATITDINGCQIISSIVLTQPTILSSTLSPSTYSGGYNLTGCFPNGSIDLNVTGGNSGYTYSWSNGSIVQDVNGLTAGTYSVVITDMNGCQTTNSTTLIAPTTLSTTISAFTYPSGSNISCNGLSDGSIDLVVTGGAPTYTYVWSNGATNQDISNVPSGSYSVTITDANGCQVTSLIALTQPSPLSQSVSTYTYPSGTNISCFGSSDGSIDLNVNGGSPVYTYNWSNGSNFQDLVGLSAGTYSATITDINGCQIISTITLVQPAALVSNALVSVYAGGYNLSGCGQNGWIDLSVMGGNGGYIYAWANGLNSQDISTLSAGSYAVTVTDMNGCQTDLDTVLNQPPGLISTTQVTTDYNGEDISCFGESDGAITVNIVGGTPTYSYEWLDSLGNMIGTSQDVNGLSAGTYTINFVDQNGCIGSNTVTLAEPEPFTYDINVSTDYNGQDISCFNASDGGVNLSLSGGTPAYSFVWTNELGANVGSSEDLSNVPAGNYFVAVHDVNGCFFDTVILLNQPTNLLGVTTVTSDYNGQNVSCYLATDGAVDVTATGGTPGYVYTWINIGGSTLGTNSSLSSVGAGTYFVQVTDLNGCVSNVNVNVTQPAPLTSGITVVSDFFGQAISCEGATNGIIEANVSGGLPGYSYEWSTQPVQTTMQAINLGVGNYLLTVTDSNGCVSTSEVNLTANPLPVLNLPEPIEGCIGQNIVINSQFEPGSSCTWVFSDGQEYNECGSVTVSFPEQNCYGVDLTVVSSEGCVSSASMDSFICIMPNPLAGFYADNYNLTNLENGTNFFNTSMGAESYLWDFGDGSPTETDENVYHEFGNGDDFLTTEIPVTLYAITDIGCTDTVVMYIHLNPELIFYVPNAFTPDGDDYNNFFKPVFSSGYDKDGYSFRVFNRWGEIVYETKEIGDGWDGLYKSNKCQDGVYTWKLNVKNSFSDQKEEHIGHVSLLRGSGTY